MSRRLYLGRLGPDVRSEDVSKLFEGYGGIVDCRVMTGFGFVEFENSKDAEDAVTNFNGKSFMGSNIVVEFAKESRPRREPAYNSDRSFSSRSRRPPGIRLVVSGLSRDTSWQDLKDFGREAGSVSFADIDRDYRDQGVLEYLSKDDADRAVRDLDGKDLRGRPVRVEYDDNRSGPNNYRRDDRRDDRDRYDRDRDRDRYREDRSDRDRDRYRDDRRRDRSRSPRRDTEDRRRSPPPPRKDDDRRCGDRDKDDRRRDDKDERYDDRTARNGDAGWAAR
ncbi:hypothetical protein GGX14DRAFT_602148 [Mycena pura]|uniref:RRM domain-containing protein n=1 Tax=Mycena pura TaxID=153505 RepID=A0AAD6VQQ8_9AGAR|nr:hypothetical protein GGX14DRAFT_602148 [Mycena pura]